MKLVQVTQPHLFIERLRYRLRLGLGNLRIRNFCAAWLGASSRIRGISSYTLRAMADAVGGPRRKTAFRGPRGKMKRLVPEYSATGAHAFRLRPTSP